MTIYKINPNYNPDVPYLQLVSYLHKFMNNKLRKNKSPPIESKTNYYQFMFVSWEPFLFLFVILTHVHYFNLDVC